MLIVKIVLKNNFFSRDINKNFILFEFRYLLVLPTHTVKNLEVILRDSRV